MICPKCSSPDNKVIDSRPGKTGASIRRRRQCLNCTHRFSTIEEVLREDLTVIKRDGKREDFDRSKVLKGLKKALEKRPIPAEDVDHIVQQITMSLQNEFDTEVPTSAVGEAIMAKLKDTDQIAYVRFASVYKDFHDISQIAKEIKTLAKVQK